MLAITVHLSPPSDYLCVVYGVAKILIDIGQCQRQCQSPFRLFATRPFGHVTVLAALSGPFGDPSVELRDRDKHERGIIIGYIMELQFSRQS